jgi:hypothetical protein
MKLALTILVASSLLAGPAAAQGILFDFNDAPLRASLPITLTVGGVTATLSATGQGYSVQNVDVVGFTPQGFSGYWLYPNGVAPSDIRVTFSATLKNFSIMYSPQELGCDFSAVMRATGFLNDVFVATNTTTAPTPGVWPTGLLTLASAQGFDSVVVHYESRPACIDSANFFMADNMTVTPAGCVPDATTACLIGGRYKVTSHWQNQYAGGQVSTLSAAGLTDATAAFWLSDASIYEYLIRINTATDNGRAWIAIPTFTDVEFWVAVTDTVRGQYYEYHSPAGNRTLIYDPYFFVYP